MGNWPATITQAQINSYAEASGDFNALHVDPDFGRTTPFGSTIAHGTISEALIIRYLVQDMGLKGRLKAAQFKLIGAVRPGDSLTCGAMVSQDAQDLAADEDAYDFWCQNQREEKVTVGRAVARREGGA